MSRKKPQRFEGLDDPWGALRSRKVIQTLGRKWPGVNPERWIESSARPGLLIPDPSDETTWGLRIGEGADIHVFKGVSVRFSGDPQSDPVPSAQNRGWVSVPGYSHPPRIEPADRPAEPGTDSQLAPPSPNDILERLRRSQDDPGVRLAVIDAEAMRFTAPQSVELAALLRGFIDRYRGAQDGDALIAIGSAIRKYVAEIPAERLDEVATLLDGSPAEDMELEVAKMVVRKLAAVPPDDANRYPAVAEKLVELVEAYAHPRHLRRPVCAATLLNSVLAMAIIRGPGWMTVRDKVRSLTTAWFRQQIARRAERLSAELSARSGGGSLRPPETALPELIGLSRA